MNASHIAWLSLVRNAIDQVGQPFGVRGLLSMLGQPGDEWVGSPSSALGFRLGFGDAATLERPLRIILPWTAQSANMQLRCWLCEVTRPSDLLALAF
jgi:hypothetical protein